MPARNYRGASSTLQQYRQRRSARAVSEGHRRTDAQNALNRVGLGEGAPLIPSLCPSGCGSPPPSCPPRACRRQNSLFSAVSRRQRAAKGACQSDSIAACTRRPSTAAPRALSSHFLACPPRGISVRRTTLCASADSAPRREYRKERSPESPARQPPSRPQKSPHSPAGEWR